MLSPDLPHELDKMGFPEDRFGTLRLRYYEAVHQLAIQGRKAEALELIRLAVGIKAFDEAERLPVKKRRYRAPNIINQPRSIPIQTAKSQLEHFDYKGEAPFCYEILFQDDAPELREAAKVIFDIDKRKPIKALRQMGSNICGRCVRRNMCDATPTAILDV